MINRYFALSSRPLTATYYSLPFFYSRVQVKTYVFATIIVIDLVQVW